jgi:hypothetical protein
MESLSTIITIMITHQRKQSTHQYFRDTWNLGNYFPPGRYTMVNRDRRHESVNEVLFEDF